jgi:hypothetical protein
MGTLQKLSYDMVTQTYGMTPYEIKENDIEYQLLDVDGVNCIDLGKCVWKHDQTTYHWRDGPSHSVDLRFEKNNDHEAFGNLRNASKDGLTWYYGKLNIYPKGKCPPGIRSGGKKNKSRKKRKNKSKTIKKRCTKPKV